MADRPDRPGDPRLFRAAGAELTESPTPPKVVITEFVDVARAFFPEGKEAGFRQRRP